jgi:hypothetical protein
MIAARIHNPNGTVCLMIVLEPGNIEKLKKGEPIHNSLNEFMPELNTPVELLFCYTPDAVWVAEQVGKSGGDAYQLVEALKESLSRPEVLVRGKSAEKMKRV